MLRKRRAAPGALTTPGRRDIGMDVHTVFRRAAFASLGAYSYIDAYLCYACIERGFRFMPPRRADWIRASAAIIG